MSRLFRELTEKNGRVALGLSSRSNIEYLNDINALNVNMDKPQKFEFEVKAISDKEDTVTEVQMLIDYSDVTIVDVLKFTYNINRSIVDGNLSITAELVNMIDCDGEVTSFGKCKPFEVLSIPFTEGAYIITNDGLAQLLFADFCSSKPDLYNTATISKIFIATPLIVDYGIDISDTRFATYWYDIHNNAYQVCRTKVIGNNFSGTERTWWSAKCGLHVSLENYVINGIVLTVSVARRTNDLNLYIDYITSKDVVETSVSMTLQIPILTEREIEDGWKPLVNITKAADCYKEDKIDLFVMANSVSCEIDLYINSYDVGKCILIGMSDRGFPVYKEIDDVTYPKPINQITALTMPDWETLIYVFQEVSNIGITGVTIEPMINNGSMYYLYLEDMEEAPVLEEVLTIIKQPNPFERFL